MSPTPYTKERIGKLHAGRDLKIERAKATRARQEATGAFLCSKCEVLKPLADFPQGRKNRFGQPRYAYCKPCHNRYQRALFLRRTYDMTFEEYATIETFQGGVCALCLHPPKKVRLAVDHDHTTGLVRGLLCAWCNRAIGQFRDDIEKVRRVVQFFIDPPATKALGAAKYGLKGRVSNKLETRRRLNPERYRRKGAK